MFKLKEKNDKIIAEHARTGKLLMHVCPETGKKRPYGFRSRLAARYFLSKLLDTDGYQPAPGHRVIFAVDEIHAEGTVIMLLSHNRSLIDPDGSNKLLVVDNTRLAKWCDDTTT